MADQMSDQVYSCWIHKLKELVTFGIINFNGSEKLLTTIVKLTDIYPQTSIFVVDDGSTDDSVACVRSNFPQVDIFEMGENTGRINRVRAKAVLECHTPYLMLIDNDISFQQLCVPYLLECMLQNKNILISRPRLMYCGRPNLLYRDTASIHFLGISADDRRGVPYDESFPTIMDNTFGGGIMLLNVSKALEIGNFDDRYLFGWGDDAELSVRGRLCGYRSVYCSYAVAYHDESLQGTGRVTGQIYNRWRFIATLYSKRTLIIIIPALVTFELALAVFLNIGKNRRGYWRAVRLFVAEVPEILQRRRMIGSIRIEKSDRCFLDAGRITLTGYLGTAYKLQTIANIISKILTFYWIVVSPVVGREYRSESNYNASSIRQND